jgi:hypothetical protein
MRQVGHRMLFSRQVDAIRLSTVSNDGIARNSQLARWGQDPYTFVPKPIDIGRN